MPSIELTSKSAEEAKKTAADKLGVPADQIEIVVLETTKGLFGKSNVRVKATVIEQEAPAAPAPKKEAAPKAARAPKAAPAEPAEEPEIEAPAKPERRSRAKKEDSPAKEAETEEAGDARPDATQADADVLLQLLQDVVASGDLAVTAEVKEISGRYVSIEIDGKDLGYLVGKHGEVLNALQYLINIMANRKLDNGVRATLDGDNYRRRREEKLTALAQKIAAQVLERSEEAVLDALPAFERRIVHKALSEIEGIATYSEGEEPNRRVVIAPAE
jgi:spoIIIJ-associated protein